MSDVTSHKTLDRRALLKGAALTAASLAAVAARHGSALAQDDAPEAPATGPDVPAGAAEESGPTIFLDSITNLTPQTPPEMAVIVLNRLAYGPRPGAFDYSSFRAMPGATDADKLVAWVDWQLNPTAIPEPEFDSVLARLQTANVIPSYPKTQTQQWVDYMNTGGADRTRPLEDVRTLTVARAVFSRRQLYEMMVEFWHNHFTIYAWDYSYASTTWMAYDRDVIRANALGNFRTFLEAVAKSPAMLFYMDNYLNDQGSNENWARELFEVYGMGAENYLGSALQQSQVPGYPTAPTGYVDADVYEAARAFAGWRVRDGMWPYDAQVQLDNGTYYFYPDWRDRFQKTVLGQFMTADPASDAHGRQVLDLIAAHPGTARFICRKLIRRFITDTPGEALVESAAAVFIANAAAPNQIALTLRHILLSDDFKTTWGMKFKRPFEYAMGILRSTLAATYPEFDALYWNYDDLNQPMFAWRPPNGYPDVASAWINTNGLLTRWNFANRTMLGYIDQWVNGATVNVVEVDIIGQTPGNTIAEMVDGWVLKVLGRPLSNSAHRDELLRILGNGAAPNTVPNKNTNEFRARLRHTVALIYMTSEWQWR
ncbi:MAG: DUF1800 domain-containing protein [Anaerolineales bacterium]|nr:DUF1800 domain-containing protein [Anaerolineales bacterium]